MDFEWWQIPRRGESLNDSLLSLWWAMVDRGSAMDKP
jgi:hypothetical protein